MSKNSGPLKTTCILKAFIPTDRQQRQKLLRDHRDIQLYEHASCGIYSRLYKPTNGWGWQEGRRALVGKMEEEHWWWGTTRSVKGFLSLRLLWGNFLWTQVFAHAATYRCKLGCRKTIKFHRNSLWLWKSREEKGSLLMDQCVRVGPLHGSKLG